MRYDDDMNKVFLYTDGGSRGNPGVAGAGAVVLNEKGEVVVQGHKSLGVVTNNEAEYLAVVFGLKLIKKNFSKEKLKDLLVELRLDSELVAKQLLGQYQLKEEKLVPLFIKIWNLRVKDFPRLNIEHIPREKNKLADELANKAMDESGFVNGSLL